MNFLPKEVLYHDVDISSSYNHLLEKNKKLVMMLEGMGNKSKPQAAASKEADPAFQVKARKVRVSHI
jgi:hypothetical protein